MKRGKSNKWAAPVLIVVVALVLGFAVVPSSEKRSEEYLKGELSNLALEFYEEADVAYGDYNEASTGEGIIPGDGNACADNQDCAGPTPYCDLVSGKCVDCTESWQYGNGNKCLNNVCTAVKGSCTDTDGGYFPKLKGTVTSDSGVFTGGGTFTDKCYPPSKDKFPFSDLYYLKENYCTTGINSEGSAVIFATFVYGPCKDKCVDGACDMYPA